MTSFKALGAPSGSPNSASPTPSGNRRLLMVPGRQSQLVGGGFDPTQFTAHELPANANRNPATVTELYQLLGWHEEQLRAGLVAALRELPDPAQAAGDLTLAPSPLQDRIQDLAARYGLAAALTGRLAFGQETLRELDLVENELAELNAALPPTVHPEVRSTAQLDVSGLISTLDLALRRVSLGELTTDDRSRRNGRVWRDLPPVLPERLASASGVDPVRLVDTAWLTRSERISDQARRAMRVDGGSAPTDADLLGRDRNMLHTPDPTGRSAGYSRNPSGPAR